MGGGSKDLNLDRVSGISGFHFYIILFEKSLNGKLQAAAATARFTRIAPVVVN